MLWALSFRQLVSNLAAMGGELETVPVLKCWLIACPPASPPGLIHCPRQQQTHMYGVNAALQPQPWSAEGNALLRFGL